LTTRAWGIGLVNSLQKTMPSARKSSAYFARPVTFANRSGGTKSLPISSSAICDTPARYESGPAGQRHDDTEDYRVWARARRALQRAAGGGVAVVRPGTSRA